MRRFLLTFVLTLAAGCGSTAATLRPTMNGVPATSAVLVGKLGILHKGFLTLNFIELEALELATKKTWKIPISADDRSADSNSAAFFVELPPGKYLFTKWMFMTPRYTLQGEHVGALVELQPGKAACVGGVYMGSQGRLETTAGAAEHFKGGTVVKDECPDLTTRLKAKAPLVGPPETHLAYVLPRRS